MQTKNIHDEQIAIALTGGEPLSFRRLADGGMVIIAANGMKLTISAEKVRAAEAQVNADGNGQAVPTPSLPRCESPASARRKRRSAAPKAGSRQAAPHPLPQHPHSRVQVPGREKSKARRQP